MQAATGLTVEQVLLTTPLIVKVSPRYDVLVTCALRLSDGDMF